MRERVTVVTLSVCLSVCHFSILEKELFSGLKFDQYILGEDLSPLNVALFSKSKLFWRKSEWNFGHNCSMYSGTAQSLNGLARDLLAHGTLYQSCHLRCSCACFPRIVAGLQRLLFPANSKLVCY